MIRVVLPANLKVLAAVGGEVKLEVPDPVTLRRTLDALEAGYPALKGTIRDHQTKQRRAMIRFYACEEDWSDEPVDDPLPADVVSGREPLLIIGAMAGG